MKSLLLSLLVFAAGAHAANEQLKAGVFDPPRAAPELSLQGSDGTELKLSRYRGKVVVLGFGFTSCPEICPTTLATLAKARKKLGASANELQVVYVTVDPERDNPERMRQYLAAFDSSFIGGTGTPQQLSKVRQEYGVVGGKDHSTFVYLIDGDGRLRALSPYGRSADDIAHDVTILLKK